jgi:acetyl esterase/lipase
MGHRIVLGRVVAALMAGVSVGVAAAQPAVPQVPAPEAKTTPVSVPQAVKPVEGVPVADDRVLLNLEYAKPDGKPVKLDLFLPKKGETPAPVVIWIHGGGWQAGSKAMCPARGMVRDGFAVASVEYRFTDRAAFPAQIQDCKAAVRYLRAHAKEHNLDPERFGAWGASAGGHLVALLGTSCGNKECEGAELGNAEQSSAVQCVCDWFGPTDFTEYKAESADVAPMLVKLFGGKMSEKQELVRMASPALHIKKEGAKYPPFLIVQGDKDPLVPWEQSKELADKLKEAGVSAELVIVEGAGHGFGEKNGAEMARVREFFKARLMGEARKMEKPAQTPAPKAG